VVLAVPDAAVAEVAARLAAEADLAGKTVLHTSGVLGSGALAAAARRGARVGRLHPLAAFPPAGGAGPARGVPDRIAYAVGGPASRTARRIAAALGGTSLEVPDRSLAVYHLAATLTANFPTVLAALALDLLGRRGGLRGARLRAAFAALLRTASDRIREDGPERGLTGPAARGDLATLRAHQEILRTEPRDLGTIYGILSLRAARIALRRGALPPPLAGRVARLLRVGGRRR
jgi:predicted short-subunit dehydrogenase-like oxidoreductase (DUF2520 family)